MFKTGGKKVEETLIKIVDDVQDAINGITANRNETGISYRQNSGDHACNCLNQQCLTSINNLENTMQEMLKKISIQQSQVSATIPRQLHPDKCTLIIVPRQKRLLKISLFIIFLMISYIC